MGKSDTRARIQGAATVLFRRHGYSATGLKRVATEAEAPFGSIYSSPAASSNWPRT